MWHLAFGKSSWVQFWMHLWLHLRPIPLRPALTSPCLPLGYLLSPSEDSSGPDAGEGREGKIGGKLSQWPPSRGRTPLAREHPVRRSPGRAHGSPRRPGWMSLPRDEGRRSHTAQAARQRRRLDFVGPAGPREARMRPQGSGWMEMGVRRG